MNTSYTTEPKKLDADERFIISGTLPNERPEFKIGDWKIRGIHGFILCEKNGKKCVQIDTEFFFTKESIYHKDNRIDNLDYLKGDVCWEDWGTIKSNIINKF